MAKVKNITIIHVVIIILYLTITSVSATLKEMNQCLYQLNYAFKSLDTFIDCVKYAIEYYVTYEDIPVRNLEDPNEVESVEVPESENLNYDNYAKKYYDAMQPFLNAEVVPLPKTFCRTSYRRPLVLGCTSALTATFGDSPLQALTAAFLYNKLLNFGTPSYEFSYMKEIIEKVRVFAIDRENNNVTNMEPFNFCLQFITTDQLPDASEIMDVDLNE